MGRGREDARAAFGQRVRERRRATGLSQQALADLAGLHRTYIGSGERNVALLSVLHLAAAVGVDPADLVRDLRA